MRVISDASKDIEKRLICHKCGTEIGYLPIDIQEKICRDYGGGYDTIKWIKCPKCKREIVV